MANQQKRVKKDNKIHENVILGQLLLNKVVKHTTSGKYGRQVQVIDTYRIVEWLGSGGFGACFKAIKSKDERTPVALKVIKKFS